MNSNTHQLKSLKQHNLERIKMYNEIKYETPCKNGIACPNCGNELIDDNPNTQLLSYPPSKTIRCSECGFRGYRVA